MRLVCSDILYSNKNDDKLLLTRIETTTKVTTMNTNEDTVPLFEDMLVT